MKTFAVDGNWYLHRIYHTQPEEAKDPAGLLVRRFLSLVCRDAIAARCQQLVVAFDGNKVFRFKIFAGYKGERGEGSLAYDYLDGLKTYLVSAGIQVIHLMEHEADDVLCSLSKLGPTVVGTKDKDSYQYLTEGVELYDSSAKPKPRVTTHKDVMKLLNGLKASQSLDYQTLIGDGIDCVPQLVTPARARKGLIEYGSIKKWMAADAEFRAEMKAVAKKLNLNRKLVRLVSDLPVKIKPINWADTADFPQAYADYKTFCNPKSKGLFG